MLDSGQILTTNSTGALRRVHEAAGKVGKSYDQDQGRYEAK